MENIKKLYFYNFLILALEHFALSARSIDLLKNGWGSSASLSPRLAVEQARSAGGGGGADQRLALLDLLGHHPLRHQPVHPFHDFLLGLPAVSDGQDLVEGPKQNNNT